MANTAVLFLKEPGKSISIEVKNLASSKDQKLLNPGIELKPKFKGKSYFLVLGRDTITRIDQENAIQKIKYAQNKGFEIRFYVIKKTKQAIEILIRCNRAIFISRSQMDIKPFTKHEEVLEEELSRESDNTTEDDEDSLEDGNRILEEDFRQR